MNVGAVVAVYGEMVNSPWVGACLESLVSPGGVRDIIVVTDFPNPGWVKWAQTRQVSLAAIKMNANGEAVRFRQFANSQELKQTARLVAWRAALRLLSGKFVALDVDTLVRRPLETLFEQGTPRHFNLAVSRTLMTSGRHHYHSGVLAGETSPIVDRYLDDWTREILRLGGQRAQLTTMYGSLESAAWHTLVSRAEESGGIIIGHLPEAWCLPYTDTIPEQVSDEAGILHFKRVAPSGADSPVWQAWAIAGRRSGL